jgi:hypothetical protein
MKILSSLVLATIALANGQITYLDAPVEGWRASFAPMEQGNGVFLSPDGSMVVAIASNCLVRAFGQATGEVRWTSNPPPGDGSSSCNGGITFNDNADIPYFTYMVNDNVQGTISTRVIMGDIDTGDVLMTSEVLAGSSAGSPQTTLDGRHIMFTHNDGGTGIFSILDTMQDPDMSGMTPIISPIFSESNATEPFSAVGVFHDPNGGNYAGGLTTNRNDIFVWSLATNFDVNNTRPPVGEAGVFGFQFPVDFNNTGDDLDILYFGSFSFQATTRPVLASNGTSMYWGVTRGEYRAWFQRAFDRPITELVTLSRDNVVPSLGARAAVTLSSDPINPIVFGPGPNEEFFRGNSDFSETTIISTSPSDASPYGEGIVSGRAAVSPDDQFVYYATQGGLLTQAETDALASVWTTGGAGNITIESVRGDLAISRDGSRVFVPDTVSASGFVIAVQVAEVGETPPPTGAPISMDMSMAPSGADGSSGTAAPSLPDGATAPPNAEGTDAPGSTPAPAPASSAIRASMIALVASLLVFVF